MGLLAIALIAVLLIAFIGGLVWLVVSLGGVALKGGPGLRSPKGFAAVAASQGWTYTERDEELPRSLSPLLPETYDNTAALDVLRGRPQGHEITIFRYAATDPTTKDSLTIWTVPLPRNLPAFTPADPASAHTDHARALSPLTASMNAQDFASWRLQDGRLQAWKAGGNLSTPQLLAGAQSLVHAIGEVPSETWQKYGQ